MKPPYRRRDSDISAKSVQAIPGAKSIALYRERPGADHCPVTGLSAPGTSRYSGMDSPPLIRVVDPKRRLRRAPDGLPETRKAGSGQCTSADRDAGDVLQIAVAVVNDGLAQHRDLQASY